MTGNSAWSVDLDVVTDAIDALGSAGQATYVRTALRNVTDKRRLLNR